jgi:hypothetical protein
MKKPLLLLVLMLTACGAIPQPASVRAEQAISTPAETATEAPTEVPTQDFQATSAFWATKSAQDERAALDSRAAELDAKATVEAAQIAQGMLTQSASELAATVTAENNIANATRQAGIQTQNALFVAATATGQANMITLLQEQKAAAVAQADEKTATGRSVGFVLCGIGIIGIALVLGWHVYNHRMPEPEYDDNEAEDVQIPPVQISTARNETFEHTVAISNEEKAILRRAAVDLGGRFSRRTITPQYFSDTRWRDIDDELMTPGYNGVSFAGSNPDDSISLTDAGYKWLGLTRPSSPPPGYFTETPPPADETHPTPPQNTEGR